MNEKERKEGGTVMGGKERDRKGKKENRKATKLTKKPTVRMKSLLF